MPLRESITAKFKEAKEDPASTEEKKLTNYREKRNIGKWKRRDVPSKDSPKEAPMPLALQDELEHTEPAQEEQSVEIESILMKQNFYEASPPKKQQTTGDSYDDIRNDATPKITEVPQFLYAHEEMNNKQPEQPKQPVQQNNFSLTDQIERLNSVKQEEQPPVPQKVEEKM
jgi:hypothetical protein